MSYDHPRDRLELLLKEVVDDSTPGTDRRTRFESFMNGIVTSDLTPADARNRLELYLTELSGRAGGGSPPTGTINITTNGDHDVTSYATAHVAVPGITPTGTINITSNGTHDVTNYATAAVSVTGTVPVFGRSLDVTIMPVDGTEAATLTIIARTPGDPGSEQNLKFSSFTPEQVFDPDDPEYFDYQATVDLVPGVGDGFFLTVDDWSIGSITAGAQYFLSRTVGTQKIYYIFINDINLQTIGIDLN